MAEHTPGPWAWLDDSLIAADDQIVLEPCDSYFSPELLKCSDADKRPIAAALEIKAQLDQALIVLKQAIPFVIAWANDHPNPEGGNASRIGMRVAARMEALIGKGDPLLAEEYFGEDWGK